MQSTKFFTDAIAAADPYIEYALYDTNGDTAIDASELAIIVVVAGHEASTSGTLYGPSVWAHANLGIAETDDFVTETSCETICEPMPVNVTSKPGYTGPTEICYEECETTTHSIWVVGAAEMGEIHDNDHQATLGVMVHELGHTIFGLPDLYDRDGTSSGIGGFGLMAAGSWGQDVMVDTYRGETPVLPTAWSQYKLQWIDAKISVNIVATGRNSLPALKPTVGRATAGVSWFNGVVSACSSTEYFLMQYRANIGYDRGLNWFLDPLGGNFQAGVVVYHVDESVDHNDWDSKRLVDVEEANGTAMGTGTGFYDQLWYQGNFTLFNSTTTPASNTYSGVDSGVAMEVLNNYVTTTGQEAVYVDIESQCDVSKFAMFQSPFP